MLSDTPLDVAVWTEDGRNDSRAAVGLTAEPDRSMKVFVDAPVDAITAVAIRWAGVLPEKPRILGDHWERGYGDLEWRGVSPERPLPWYALIHSLRTGETRGVGVRVGAASFASWRVDETGITLVLDLKCGGRGVRLSGRTLHAATIHDISSKPGEGAFAFACRFCAVLSPTPKLSAAPVYGGNDWYFRYGNITEATVRQDAELIRELSPAGDNAPAYVIDMGWYPTDADENATYERGHSGFPDMPGLAGWMSSQNVRPGIWMRPLMKNSSLPESWRIPREHPLYGTRGVFLDPSIPEVLDHVREDVTRIRQWGYQTIKHDFTTYDILGRWGFAMGSEMTAGGWAFADRSLTTAEVIKNLYAAIREAAGDVILIGCNTVGHLGAGIFELQRTGDDTSGRHWERTRKMGINSLAFRMPQHGSFFCADADCAGLRPDVPWEQNKLWLDVLARSGTALFVSADPNAVGPEQKEALKEAFAIAAVPAPGAEPLDWMDTTCPRRWRMGDETREYDWNTFPGTSFACPP